jgi:hypothetical protein
LADEDRLAKAERLASNLIALAIEVAQVESRRREQRRDADSEAPWSLDLFDHWTGDWRGLSRLVETVDALDRVLVKAGFDAEPLPVGAWDFISLGTVTFYGKPQQIHAGFVQPVLRLPIVTRLPSRVIAFLTRIPGDDEWLARENHDNIGYHYHYLNARKERSDVAICWDTRADPQAPHPLFQEKHGESHSKFSGRPDLWGETKCRSIHEACAKDLKRWTLDKFRMACDKAGPVWPLGAVLTAKPAQKALPPRFPSKKGRARRR